LFNSLFFLWLKPLLWLRTTRDQSSHGCKVHALESVMHLSLGINYTKRAKGKERHLWTN
jgi:hypothetical protein